MKKIIIIGGGIAGLTAGVFAQKYGFESEIFESHNIVGGECTGWSRNGFHIDNCIHWMTGTNEDTELYELWKDVGALGENIELIKLDSFYTSCVNGKRLSLYRDVEKTRAQMLAVAPEDKREIDSFIDAVKAAQAVNMPVEIPMDMMPKLKMMKLGMSMMGVLKHMKKYGGLTVRQFVGNFKNPELKTFLSDYMFPEYSAFALISSYATFVSGNGDIPRGGSLKMAQRMADKYKSLGGKIHTNSRVVKINIENTAATGITLADGSTVSADYIIPACDTGVTFGKLLDKKYMPPELAENYKKLPVTSAFQVAFGVDDTCDFIYNTEFFDCRDITIAHSVSKRMSVRNYSYEPSFAPEGKTVLQSHFVQSEEDFEFWEKLYTTDKARYDEIKTAKAEEIKNAVIANYPQLEGKIRVLDIITPYTYYRYTGAYKGAYMNFIYSPEAMSQQPLNGIINGLDNVVLGTQWQQLPGGLPVAAAMGKFAVQRIAK